MRALDLEQLAVTGAEGADQLCRAIVDSALGVTGALGAGGDGAQGCPGLGGRRGGERAPVARSLIVASSTVATKR